MAAHDLAATFRQIQASVNAPDQLKVEAARKELEAKIKELDLNEPVVYTKKDVEGRYITTQTTDRFSPDGKRLATADWRDTKVRVWDTEGGDLLTSLSRQFGVRCLAFSPDGTRLVSAGSDKTVRVWDVVSGDELRNWDSAAEVLSVAFSPDGRLVAGGNARGTVAVWQVGSGAEEKAFRLPSPLPIWRLRFDDSKRLLVQAGQQVFHCGLDGINASPFELVEAENSPNTIHRSRSGRQVARSNCGTRIVANIDLHSKRIPNMAPTIVQ